MKLKLLKHNAPRRLFLPVAAKKKRKKEGDLKFICVRFISSDFYKK